MDKDKDFSINLSLNDSDKKEKPKKDILNSDLESFNIIQEISENKSNSILAVSMLSHLVLKSMKKK